MKRRVIPDTSSVLIPGIADVNLDETITTISQEMLSNVALPCVVEKPWGGLFHNVEDAPDLDRAFNSDRRFKGIADHCSERNIVMTPWMVHGARLSLEGRVYAERERNAENWIQTRWGNIEEVGGWPADNDYHPKKILSKILFGFLLHPELHDLPPSQSQ